MKIKKCIVYVISLAATVGYTQGPDTLWTRTYGGIAYDAAYSVHQTADSGYFVVGETFSFGVGGDVWLLRTDANGDTLWTKTIGGNDHDGGYSSQPTNDGGYVIVGKTQSYGAGGEDIWLLKLDADFDTVWTRTYGGAAHDRGQSVQQTSDNGYIITGSTYSFGAGVCDLWLIKTDSLGVVLWDITYGYNHSDCGYSVQQTPDNGYIIAGYTETLGTDWILKTDANGDTLWTNSYLVEGCAYSVQQTTDSGYVIAGCDGYGSRYPTKCLVKADANGDTSWVSYFSFFRRGTVGFSARQTADGGYILAGGGHGDTLWGYLVKTDANGDYMWGITAETWPYGHAVEQTSDQGYIVAGWVHPDINETDLFLAKTEPDVGLMEDKDVVIRNEEFPATIFSGSLFLPDEKECRVFDIMGSAVEPDMMHPGIYFIEIDGIVIQKVVKIK